MIRAVSFLITELDEKIYWYTDVTELLCTPVIVIYNNYHHSCWLKQAGNFQLEKEVQTCQISEMA